ncbi:hypothetical protein [Gordonibacter massiliensis (ex Traore et al. 2017)]|uniref:hypothetical protein n=1 Tax=Gordonibacter massiliensis (ex Traore et al. 2017) TaxID=1841863 RepID=UPI001C8C6283|nr:hypothetical protein [Gordonibacter massiliensis (ex Traore et al. 2017)]MBX9033759.1 hypothetical protein [Gordonibacter massiliensis (ex Traore et al. 2017)]
MEEGMTRKGFLVAAAAASAAALAPTAAFAVEPGVESQIGKIDVEAVEGVEALAGSGWAEAAEAGYPIDVVKSHSGLHSMNAPGYFVFTGWDPENDWVGDLGFGFFNNEFFVRSQRVDLWSQEISINGERIVDWIIEEGRSGAWSYRKYANGTAECWIRRSYDVPMSAWSASSFYPQGYSASGDYCAQVDYPFAFSEPPCETFSMLGVEGGWCEVFSHSIRPNTAATSGYYQVYRTSLPEAMTIGLNYSLSVRGTIS